MDDRTAQRRDKRRVGVCGHQAMHRLAAQTGQFLRQRKNRTRFGRDSRMQPQQTAIGPRPRRLSQPFGRARRFGALGPQEG